MRRTQLLLRTILFFFIIVIFLLIVMKHPYNRLVCSSKYLAYFILATCAITILRKVVVSTSVRIVFLFLSVVIFGIYFDIHPSPLCTFSKSLVNYLERGFIPPPMLVMAVAIVLLTIVGNKIFCGWICPLGCIQEALFILSAAINKIKLPFIISNCVRFLAYLFFFIVLYLLGANIYDFLNPFELFHRHLHYSIVAVVTFTFVASLWFYRPYCHYVCPAGFVTWLFEPLSLLKIQKSKKKCTHCKRCIQESPCLAVESIIQARWFVPDCFACGICIKSCPEGALSFSLAAIYQLRKKDPQCN